jgi:four helix bundle protein
VLRERVGLYITTSKIYPSTNYSHSHSICILEFIFDFEKLEVYKKAKFLNKEVLLFLKENKRIDSYLKDQLRRASISMVINIAEGSGKFSKADKKNFYITARGSTYECVSLFEIILEENEVTKESFDIFYQKFEIISKMLLGLINSQIP